MAKSWQYPRWRRVVMQGTMWLILGATVGLAALVNYEVRRALYVELADEDDYDNLVVRLPKGWVVSAGPGRASPVLVVAKEPGEGATRSLTILRQRIDSLISPAEFLLRDPLLATAVSQSGELLPMPVADRPGILAAAQLEYRAPGGRAPQPRKLVRVCTVLPSRTAIVVQLDGYGLLSEADGALARQIAAALQVTGEPWLDDAARTVELPDGTIAGVPEHFHAVVDHDPNRVSRSMLLTQDDGVWVSIELVPCVYFAAHDTADTVRTMLLSHGAQHWRQARVTQESPGVWRIDPPQRPVFARRAYLVAGEQGQAMLAVFRCGPGDEAHISPAWAHIRQTLKLTGRTDYPTMRDNGIKEAARLQSRGLADLVPSRADQWWLWYQDSADTYVGFTTVDYSPRDRWQAKIESTWNQADGTRSSIAHDFEGDSFMQLYASTLLRIDSDPPLGRAFVRTLERQLQLDQRNLRMAVRQEGGVTEWQQSAPPAYVPGGWFGQIMGRATLGGGLLLRTDTLLGCEELVPLEPMMVLVEPTDLDQLPPQDRDKWPRCLSVRANGCGDVMRWHFSADGQLQQIDFSAGVHRIRSDEKTIRSFDSESVHSEVDRE